MIYNMPAKFADAVNMSFHPVKHITTGEGGAVLTNDESLDYRIKHYVHMDYQR